MADEGLPPPDVVSGKPMHYRKTLDAKYALWSVGFDSEDNPGERGSNGDKGETADPSKEVYLGDWGWDFPGK